ncbi:MAG: hypothetical protein KAY22_02260 [Rhizorhabdus sp.]|uniref:hypothetical protein n=1 Tax=Rhizorhabdus sp. TaxID=1968843 RepID=UPI001B68E7A0|nr:hypothetical protein [Rhizorhabdus sp.]MBP8231104.1 hypothetical protein [Rhizorhabdus sp.]
MSGDRQSPRKDAGRATGQGKRLPVPVKVVYHVVLWCCLIAAASFALDLVSSSGPRPQVEAIAGRGAEVAASLANGHQLFERILVAIQVSLVCSLVALFFAAAVYYRLIKLPRAHRAIAGIVERMKRWTSPPPTARADTTDRAPEGSEHQGEGDRT